MKDTEDCQGAMKWYKRAVYLADLLSGEFWGNELNWERGRKDKP